MAIHGLTVDTCPARLAPVFVGQRYNVKAFHYSSANGRSRHWEGIAPVDVTGREPAVTVVLQAKQ